MCVCVQIKGLPPSTSFFAVLEVGNNPVLDSLDRKNSSLYTLDKESAWLLDMTRSSTM